MSQYRQKEVEAIKASEEKEYRGKYALAKHETLALRCESLEKQLAEAREEYNALINKNILLIAGNSILMQQLKDKGDE